MIDLTIYCATCGRAWYPSMDASYSFPGSGCDTGNCLCTTCEGGDRTCDFHEELEAQRRAQRAQGKVRP